MDYYELQRHSFQQMDIGHGQFSVSRRAYNVASCFRDPDDPDSCEDDDTTRRA